MRDSVKSLRLEQARPPLSRLIRKDWTWCGTQPFDAVYCVRDARNDRTWRAALVPFLKHAEKILETDDAAIVLFKASTVLDCAMMGAVRPLKLQHGALTGFPFKPPQNTDIATAIDGQLLLMEAGEVNARSLALFSQVTGRDWINVSNARVEQAVAPPRQLGVPNTGRLQSRSDPLFEGEFADAGLENIRKAVGRPRPLSSSRRPVWVVPVMLVAAISVILATMITGDGGSATGTALILGGALFVAAALATLGYALAGGRWWKERADQAPAIEGHRARVRQAEPRKRSGKRTAWLWLSGLGVLLMLPFLFRDAVAAVLGALVFSFWAWLFVSIVRWIGGLLGLSGSAPAGGTDSEAGASPPASFRNATPGVLRRLLERVLRYTPLTNLALGKYERRVAELQKLFDEGRIEEALKKGLALGAQSDPNADVHADQPLAGPGIRKQLEIAASQSETARQIASLPHGAREELERLYRAQADICANNGDVEKAAFIHAELLDDAEAAVKVFADAGQFGIAAKLAQGRRLAPALFIPLWYRAGERDRALRLAERHDAYQVLLMSTAAEDEIFRNAVRRTWANRLATTGDYARALDVSEPLTGRDDAMIAWRHDRMAAGVVAAEFDAEVLARALKGLPADHARSDDDPALAAFDRLNLQRGAAAGRLRKRLAELLIQPKFEPRHVVEFRRDRLPPIADRLPRTLLVDHAEFGLLDSVGLLGGLADAGGQTSLAIDMRRLPPVRQQRRARPYRRLVFGARVGNAGVIAAVPLRGARTLVAYEDGSIRLLDAGGAQLWRDQVWQPRDIVVVSTGRMALIIRDEPNERRLSVFDSERLRHSDIGPIGIEHWSPCAEPGGWLVYSDKRVINLRLDPLLAAPSGSAPIEFEHHWATPVTIDGRLRALTFEKATGNALWLFERTDKIVERWCVSRDDLRVTYHELSFDARPAGPLSPCSTSDFFGYDAIDATRKQSHTNAQLHRPAGATAPPTSFPQVHLSSGDHAAGSPRILPVAAAAESSFGLVFAHDPLVLEIVFAGARHVFMRDSGGDRTVLWDNLGRLAVIATDRAEVAYTNAALHEPAMPE